MNQKIQFFSAKMQKLYELEATVEQNAQKIRDANNAICSFEMMQNTNKRNASIIKEKDAELNDLRANIQRLK